MAGLTHKTVRLKIFTSYWRVSSQYHDEAASFYLFQYCILPTLPIGSFTSSPGSQGSAYSKLSMQPGSCEGTPGHQVIFSAPLSQPRSIAAMTKPVIVLPKTAQRTVSTRFISTGLNQELLDDEAAMLSNQTAVGWASSSSQPRSDAPLSLLDSAIAAREARSEFLHLWCMIWMSLKFMWAAFLKGSCNNSPVRSCYVSR